MRFFDRNSAFYYSLGLIDYRVRLCRLCHEVFNKRGGTVRLGIGPVIAPEEYRSMSLEQLSAFLRGKVYGMPLPGEFVRRSEISFA